MSSKKEEDKHIILNKTNFRLWKWALKNHLEKRKCAYILDHSTLATAQRARFSTATTWPQHQAEAKTVLQNVLVQNDQHLTIQPSTIQLRIQMITIQLIATELLLVAISCCNSNRSNQPNNRNPTNQIRVYEIFQAQINSIIEPNQEIHFDTCATRFMTPNKSDFSNYIRIEDGPLVLTGNGLVKAEGVCSY